MKHQQEKHNEELRKHADDIEQMKKTHAKDLEKMENKQK